MKDKNRIGMLLAGVLILLVSVGAVYLVAARETTNAADETVSRVVFVYGSKKWTYNSSKHVPDTKIHTVKEEVARRIKPTHAERAELCKRVRGMGFSEEDAVNYAFYGIDKVVAAAARAIDCEPKPARIIFRPDGSPMFRITPEAAGYKLTHEPLYHWLYTKLTSSSSVTIALKPKTLCSPITSELLRTATALRSRFSTRYESSGENRKHNVALALSRFNGKRIDPQETVSFNKTVGARSARNGFREAKIILNGQFEDGIGGGVCQSSTTLFNALLLADVNVLKSSPHSLRVSYVEPSFDAMVNSGTSDLVFRNDGNLPVFIRTYCDSERVTVEIYGTPLPYLIQRRSEITGYIAHGGDKHIIDTDGKYSDKVLYKGEVARIQSAKEGVTSKGYLDYYRNGTLIKSRLIRTNKYAPQQGLVVEGTRERPPEPFTQPYTPEFPFFVL